MNTDTPTFEAQQVVRLRRGDLIRRLLQRDKTPLAILLTAAVVGTVTGLIGVAFEKAVTWVQNLRIGALVQTADYAILVWPLAFILSALLAMVGYFLVRKFAPEAGGSGIPEIEGALEELRPVRWWRVLPVKFVGGMGTLGAGMVLGREGPTVQIGAISGGWCWISSVCVAPRRVTPYWQPARPQGYRQPLTRRWRGSYLSSKRCARSFATI
ncbi:chloride channel protein [Citrobacter koseri]|uniref:Chloride channel protein n=1 Tax=Citrobacter koseri TaxID=545 RepID=A0A2X2VHN6_CITKO|nr:chloride channel protein [Citrobacter koseri]